MAENGVDEQQHHEAQQSMIAVRVVAMVPVLVVRLGSGKRSSIDRSKQALLLFVGLLLAPPPSRL